MRGLGATTVVVVGVLSLACGREYTRCEACFSDDRSQCYDVRELESLGLRDPAEARCHASIQLCESVDSRCMQGVCDRRHERKCKDPPPPFECGPDWNEDFVFTCDVHNVGMMVPF